jgi:hypothetical protein
MAMNRANALTRNEIMSLLQSRPENEDDQARRSH